MCALQVADLGGVSGLQGEKGEQESVKSMCVFRKTNISGMFDVMMCVQTCLRLNNHTH